MVFPIPTTSTSPQAEQTKEFIKSVGTVLKQGLGGWSWEGVTLAIGLGHLDDVNEWDELCAEAGLEFIQVKGGESGRNEFGGTCCVL